MRGEELRCDHIAVSATTVALPAGSLIDEDTIPVVRD
jgi:hypothetical protein